MENKFNKLSIGDHKFNSARRSNTNQNSSHGSYSNRGFDSNHYTNRNSERNSDRNTNLDHGSSTDEKVNLKTNWFKLKISCSTIYHYNLEIRVPDEVNIDGDKKQNQRSSIKRQKKKIDHKYFQIFERFNELIKKDGYKIPIAIVFDGRKNVYTNSIILDKENNPIVNVEKQIRQQIPNYRFPMKLMVSLSPCPESFSLNMRDVRPNSNIAIEPHLAAIDAIILYGTKSEDRMVFSNSKLFIKSRDLNAMDKNDRLKIKRDLTDFKEIRLGFYQSVKMSSTDLFLNVDSVASIFYRSGRLIDLLEDFINQRNRDYDPEKFIDNRFRFTRDQKNSINRELKGIIFSLDHVTVADENRRPLNNFYSLSDNEVSKIKFEMQDRGTRSVKDYFEERYRNYLEENHLISLLDLPAVQNKKTEHNPNFYPIEVVKIDDDQPNRGKLNKDQQASVTRFCGEQRPSDRFKNCQEQIDNLIRYSEMIRNQFNVLQAFGISIERNLTQVIGRTFANFNLIFHKNKEVKSSLFDWRSDDGFLTPFPDPDSKFAVIYFKTGDKRDYIDRRSVEVFSQKLVDTANKGNLELKNYEVLETEYRSRQQFREKFENWKTKYRFLIFILPSNNDIYHHIKYFGDIEFGILTQCVSIKKRRSFTDGAYIGNLLLKINSKLGGINWKICSKSKVGHLKKKTMIVGIDVTHPSTRDRCAFSIASIVASYDNNFVNYHTKILVQNPRQEIVNLGTVMEDLINNFIEKNSKDDKILIPDYILVYRDGVSERQFDQVLNNELKSMKDCFEKMGINPKINYIIVQKRHHTRFIPVNKEDALKLGNKENVKAGTILESVITSNLNDFYLCSHKGGLGTSRPARYTIIHKEDFENNLISIDDIKRETNMLCYLFPRTSKSISLPPAVQFAHLCAERARSYLISAGGLQNRYFGAERASDELLVEMNTHVNVAESLKNTLYFT